MKQILLFRRLFAAVLLLAVSTLSWAYHDYTFKANEIWYGVNTKRPGAEVIYDSSYNSWTSVVIPSFVTDPYTGEQRSVIGIDGAFKDCKDLTYVSIPNTVTTINGAFYGCTGLTSITIPSSVTCIGEKAFYECTGLTSITIPSSVTCIGEKAFYECAGLTSITIPSSVTSIEREAFESCTSLTSITIPDSLTTIGYRTFWGCSALTSVSVPESVTNIGEEAFSYCSGLTSIIIPNSVTSIGNGAFDACTGLTSVSIPESVTSIGSQAFAACTSLISVDIPNSVSSIGERAFMDCSALTSVTIPNSITSIESYTFEGCTSLKSVTIPENVTSICYQAFGGCSSLKEVYCMAEQVPDTHYSTVFEKSSIKSATLYVPKSSLDLYKSKEPWKYFGTILPIESDVETSYNITATANPANGGSITGTGTYQDGSTVTLTATPAEGYEFENWTANGVEVSTQATYTFTATQDRTLVANFHETDEGNRINGIYYNFDTETNTAAVTSGELKYTGDIVIPETVIYQGNTYAVTSIANSAFRECTDLTSVTIGNSVTTIGYAAFRSCSKLTSITIPNSVISIGDRAFYDCSSLTTITIPNSVTSIGGWAFFDTVWYDNQPNGMVYAGKVAYVYKGAMPSETHITLDEGTLGIAGYAFNNCSGLTSVTIPNSVTTIGDGAFAYCSGLTSVTCYAEKVPSTGINCFTSVPQSSATLYVPSVNAYKSAFQWKSFGTILPISEPYKPFSTTMAYYLYNKEADLYFCPGNSWDTQASVGEAGMDLLFEDVAGKNECFFIGDTQCAAYAVNTRIYNSATAHYLGISGDGASAYFDQESAAWYFVPQGDGTFLLSSNTTGNYLYYDGVHSALAITSDATQKGAKWHVMTREDIISKMETATEVEPVNVSSLISYADFSRNGKMRVGVWQGNPSRGGNNDNFCAEKFDCNFNVYQIFTGLPNGVYKVKAQAYYREGADRNYNPIPAVELRKSGNEHLYAKLYANNEEKPVQSIFDEVDNCTIGYQTELGFVPNSVSSAATTFLQGLYWNELLTEVTDGTLQLGIRKNEYVFYDWTCFDSFRLYYYGKDTLSVLLERLSMSTESTTFDVYDFCGHKVRTATQTLDDLPMGVYIVGNKGHMRKVVVR